MLIRLVEVGIVLIEAVLALRLLLPFMRIPNALEGVVPVLVSISDLLIAPFQVFFTPFTARPARRGCRVATWATAGTSTRWTRRCWWR